MCQALEYRTKKQHNVRNERKEMNRNEFIYIPAAQAGRVID
jgi:hypothetical protein